MRDGGCVVPSCLTPWQGCDVHHITWWSRGGSTDIDSLALLCPREHALVHDEVIDIRMIDGMPWVRMPAAVDPQRRWVHNAYWTDARREADQLGRQLRLREGDAPESPPGEPPGRAA